MNYFKPPLFSDDELASIAQVTASHTNSIAMVVKMLQQVRGCRGFLCVLSFDASKIQRVQFSIANLDTDLCLLLFEELTQIKAIDGTTIDTEAIAQWCQLLG